MPDDSIKGLKNVNLKKKFVTLEINQLLYEVHGNDKDVKELDKVVKFAKLIFFTSYTLFRYSYINDKDEIL